ncbi:hypothetical protein KKA14_01230, partial [bacterium]|nr:hypothetical protein [bacterium]
MQRLFLLLAILAVFPHHSAWSSSRNGYLTKIAISSDQAQEHIQLLFQNDFNAIPSIDFEKGLVRITLPNIDYDPSIDFQKVNDRFLQAIRLAKEGKNTILEIQFANPDLQAVGMINHRIENAELHIYIDKKKKSGDNNLENSSLPQFDKEGTSQETSFSEKSEFYRDNITTNIIK